MAAPNRKRRRTGITEVLGDVIDDTKELVDDALDRAADLERDTGRGVRHLLGGENSRGAAAEADELDSLKAALDDLAAKVDRLARLRGADGTPRP